VRGIATVIDRDTRIKQRESGKDGGIGGSLGGRTNGACRAMRRGLDMAREIVMTERQQRCRKHIEREDDLQRQADGSAREPSGCRHLHIDYTGPSGINAKWCSLR
jgi:hypothetical protein